MIFGHDSRASLLDKIIRDKSHHAVLLCGIEGIGKASLARLKSKEALKTGGDLPPAAIERLIDANAYPAHVVVTPLTDAEGTPEREITVERIRALIDVLRKKPLVTGLRTVLIDPIDKLTPQAANAFLKILEEPPQDVLFLAICHRVSSLAPTIRSRCVALNFAPLNPLDLRAAAVALNLGFREEMVPYCLGSVGFYAALCRGGGQDLIDKVVDLIETRDLGELKNKATNIVGLCAEEDLPLRLLCRILYLKTLKNKKVSVAAGAVERFARDCENTRIDPSHRLTAAILIARDPENYDLLK